MGAKETLQKDLQKVVQREGGEGRRYSSRKGGEMRMRRGISIRGERVTTEREQQHRNRGQGEGALWMTSLLCQLARN